MTWNRHLSIRHLKTLMNDVDLRRLQTAWRRSSLVLVSVVCGNDSQQRADNWPPASCFNSLLNETWRRTANVKKKKKNEEEKKKRGLHLIMVARRQEEGKPARHGTRPGLLAAAAASPLIWHVRRQVVLSLWRYTGEATTATRMKDGFWVSQHWETQCCFPYPRSIRILSGV